MEDIKIHFLGTNGWYDTENNTNCVLIDTKDAYVILDAGNGIYKLNTYITDHKKPLYLFIGHLHIDHISGLHILNKFHFKNTLHIYSYKDFKKYLDVLMNNPFSLRLDSLSYPVEIHEITLGRHENPFNFTAGHLLHISKCYGYRFELENKIIVYCVDTGICKEEEPLVQDADVLIHECSYMTPQHTSWGHSAPIETAELAKRACVKKLILTHVAANIHMYQKDREEAQAMAQNVHKDTVSAKDGMTIVV